MQNIPRTTQPFFPAAPPPTAPHLLPGEDEGAYIESVWRDQRAVAIYAPEERSSLISHFLSRYALDSAFVQELLAFYRSHRLALTVYVIQTEPRDHDFAYCENRMDWRMRKYFADLSAFLERWGLHRLPDGIGRDAVHGWCQFHRKERVIGQEPEPTEVAVYTLGHGFAPPTPAPPAPITEFERVALTWDVSRESREHVKERLLAHYGRQIDEQLDRAQRAAEGQGFLFPDRQHARARHLGWLYRRVVYHESCDVLSAHTDRGEKDAYNSQVIQAATKRLADVIGLDIPRPLARHTF